MFVSLFPTSVVFTVSWVILRLVVFTGVILFLNVFDSHILYGLVWEIWVSYWLTFCKWPNGLVPRFYCGRVVVPGRCEGRDAGVSASLGDSTGSCL